MSNKTSRTIVAIATLVCIATPLAGLAQNARKPTNGKGVPATHVNVKYGPHRRNVLDIWLAKSNTPTPVVLFIHGGGFVRGDKSRIHKAQALTNFLDSGVSFATINYRYAKADLRGILSCFRDSKRALQFIRYKAGKWNIDKTRIGAYGHSAGAGTSMWLAFHDEMAEPNSADPVLRESTRLSVVGAKATQATYDVFQWPEILGIVPAKPKKPSETAKKSPAAEIDMLGLMSSDDPPLWTYNFLAGGKPTNHNHRTHHPLHVVALKKRAEEVGLEIQAYAPKIGVAPPKANQETLVAFFLRHFK